MIQKFFNRNDPYTVGKANAYFVKNILLLKNPQYLPNHYETLTQKGTHRVPYWIKVS